MCLLILEIDTIEKTSPVSAVFERIREVYIHHEMIWGRIQVVCKSSRMQKRLGNSNTFIERDFDAHFHADIAPKFSFKICLMPYYFLTKI